MITPLPYNTPPSPRQPLLAQWLLQSSSLFPKTPLSPIITPTKNNGNIISDCVLDKVQDNLNCPNKLATDENNSRFRPSKKSVRFDTKVHIHHVDSAYVPNMSLEEKKVIWYNSNEFEHFKYDAAKAAGVKLVRYDHTENARRSHYYAMTMGDFDHNQDKDEESNSSASAATDISINTEAFDVPCGKATKNLYYNKNEYFDYGSDGEAECKRGLGFHFSRYRKKSRITFRSTIMAWQKKLHDPSNQSEFQQDLTKVGIDLRGLNKCQLVLALVSAKSSLIACEEAMWRGNVDYHEACPEQHRPRNVKMTARNSSYITPGENGTNNTNEVTYIKFRLCDDTEVNYRMDNANGKRQRDDNDHYFRVLDYLSPTVCCDSDEGLEAEI